VGSPSPGRPVSAASSDTSLAMADSAQQAGDVGEEGGEGQGQGEAGRASDPSRLEGRSPSPRSSQGAAVMVAGTSADDVHMPQVLGVRLVFC
jgi:hypothetical protein